MLRQMADYYPLIARAIAGLDPSAPGESRRALYERARAALIAQLRSVQPPLSESEITRERLSLEEAVRKVESEAAQRARDASRAGGDRIRSGDAFRASTRPQCAAGRDGVAFIAGSAPASAVAASAQRAAARTRRSAGPASAAQPSGRRATGIGTAALAAASPMPDPQLPPTRERAGAPRRGSEDGAPSAPGVRGFRDIAADADDLGRAAAQANRAARKTYANVPSPSPEFDRLEPSMEDRGADPDAPYSYDESVEEAERYAPTPPRPRLAPDREPKRRVRTGVVFPFKSAIAVGIVLILVGAAILWGKSAVTIVTGLFKPQPIGGRSAEGCLAAVEAENSRPRRPAFIDRAARAGSAARRAV
jgi:hypothetical protein